MLDEERANVAPARAARPVPSAGGIRCPDGNGPAHVRGDVGQEELTPEPKPPPAAGDVGFAEVVSELVEGGLPLRGRSLQLILPFAQNSPVAGRRRS